MRISCWSSDVCSSDLTELPVATYLDGLYLPNAAAAAFSFNNIQRIEVLKGPQGTLYGRNTTGGLIHVITKDPGDDVSVDASASYGNYATTQLNFYGRTEERGVGKECVSTCRPRWLA